MSLEDFAAKLQEFGQRPDAEVPLSAALIMLGVLDRPETETPSYTHHITELHAALRDEIAAQPLQDSNPVLSWRLARLKAVIKQFDYQSAADVDAESINFLTVIDHRRGNATALGALYLDLAEAQDWPAVGLNFPGHLLFQLEDGARHVIADPASGEEVTAGVMRQLLKTAIGPHAELHHDYYHAIGKRNIILRFYNERKTRFIAAGNYDAALRTIAHELWIAPEEPRLYFDGGVVAAKLGLTAQAVQHLNEFIQRSQDAPTIAEAQVMLRELQI